MNDVERMNGCLKVAESNRYFASTLRGKNYTNYSIDTPEGQNRLKENMLEAARVYTACVDNTTYYGDLKIQIMDGAKNEIIPRDIIHTFLSKQVKAAVKAAARRQHPEIWKLVSIVLEIQRSHELPGTNKYSFGLTPCLRRDVDCPHPICIKAKTDERFRTEV